MHSESGSIAQDEKSFTVSRGRLLDACTGKVFFEASDVDIEHLVGSVA